MPETAQERLEPHEQVVAERFEQLKQEIYQLSEKYEKGRELYLKKLHDKINVRNNLLSAASCDKQLSEQLSEQLTELEQKVKELQKKKTDTQCRVR